MSNDFILDPYNDIQMAFKMMKKNARGEFIDDFSSYSACYAFSNENMSDYYPKFDMNGGRVLTVCGSGDQVLMSILHGAKSVDCFDSNRLAYYNLMFKVGAIKGLNYGDFCSLYNIPNRVCNRKSIYTRFSNCLSGEVKYFWDYIFLNGEMILGIKEFFPYFFKERDEELFKIMDRISYLTEDNFYKLKNLLNDCSIRFSNCDFLSVFDSFNGLYDFINLSNISTYVDRLSFVKVVRDGISSHLNSSGNIMVNYSWYEANSISSINELGDMLGAEQREVSSVLYQGKDNPGSIMVCKKKL